MMDFLLGAVVFMIGVFVGASITTNANKVNDDNDV